MSLPADPAAGPARILVVDDVLANRELLAQDLEEAGYEVETAANGQACLKLAQAWHPHVVLLDIQMPGMNGIEVCRRLKDMVDTRHIPVLFVTALRTDEDSVVEALEAGGNDFLPKPYSPGILLARVQSQVTIARQHEQLRRMAMIDELTGVFSRRQLFTSFNQMVKNGLRRGPDAIAALVIDVDHFKKVNDTQGHLGGDRVLRQIASTIGGAVRETDVVARFGGEEFVVVLPQTDTAGAAAVGEKVRAAVEQACAPVTISVGASALQLPTWDAVRDGDRDVESLVEMLLRTADVAVYEAKRNGRNRVILADDVPPADNDPPKGDPSARSEGPMTHD